MKSNPPKTSSIITARARLSKASQTLMLLADACVGAQSSLEEEFWRAKLETELMIQLDKGNVKAFDAAMDEFISNHQDFAADLLGEAAEKIAETCFIGADGETNFRSIQLISLPMTVRSQYVIQCGEIETLIVDQLVKIAQSVVFAPEVQLAFVPRLYAIHHLPPDYAGLRALMKSVAETTINGEYFRDKSKIKLLADEVPVDNRFILGVAIAPRGAPVYRWQMPSSAPVDMRRDQALDAWVQAIMPGLELLFPSSEVEVALPGPFFNNARLADTMVRPHILRQAVSMVTLNGTKTSELTATLAAVGETDILEFRIGLMHKGNGTMLNGALWPIYGVADEAEIDEQQSELEIRSVLMEMGISDIISTSGLQHPEICDDCGAPLFFNRDGDAVHIEYPEEVDSVLNGNRTHLH